MEEKQKVYDCYNTLYMTWRDSCRLGPPPMDFPPLEEFMEAIVERVGGGRKAKKSSRSCKGRKTRKSSKGRKYTTPLQAHPTSHNGILKNPYSS